MAATRFEIESAGAREVYLTGDFNGWDPSARRMRRIRKRWDKFVTVVELPAGRHEFKFVIDGEWTCCPDAPRVTNNKGTENSVVEVTE
ncbi:MAG TPA: glycogen-binding domain-containing protein [Armatimonadota bacterium]|nr:glycogen-binding domain-containing protein [Armatimonadota bacterium]